MIDRGPLPFDSSEAATKMAEREATRHYKSRIAYHAGRSAELHRGGVSEGWTGEDHTRAEHLAFRAYAAEINDPDPKPHPEPLRPIDGRKPHIHHPVRDWRDPMRKGLRCSFCNVAMSTPRDFERDRLTERLNRMFGAEP